MPSHLQINLLCNAARIFQQVAALVMKCTWSGVPEKEGRWDEEMFPIDRSVIHPRSGKCYLKYEPRA
jgi:hypothetical protein